MDYVKEHYYTREWLWTSFLIWRVSGLTLAMGIYISKNSHFFPLSQQKNSRTVSGVVTIFGARRAITWSSLTDIINLEKNHNYSTYFYFTQLVKSIREHKI